MFFAYLHIILAFWFGSQIEDQAHKILKEHQTLIEQTDSNPQAYLLDFSDIFYISNSNESLIGLSERISPSGVRILFRDSLAKKNQELTINENISNYIHITVHRIIRFRCSDIIFPFNYFW